MLIKKILMQNIAIFLGTKLFAFHHENYDALENIIRTSKI
jgi:hypothetical protein